MKLHVIYVYIMSCIITKIILHHIIRCDVVVYHIVLSYTALCGIKHDVVLSITSLLALSYYTILYQYKYYAIYAHNTVWHLLIIDCIILHEKQHIMLYHVISSCSVFI